MLPGYMLKDTITIWNLVSRSATTKDQLQRTTISRVQRSIADQRTLGGDGNWKTAETLTASIDLQSSEASDGRRYIPHDEWDTAYKADPASVQGYWTIRPGFDYIGCGDIQDSAPATGAGGNAIGGRKDYKVGAVNTRTTPDGRGFLKVTAT